MPVKPEERLYSWLEYATGVENGLRAQQEELKQLLGGNKNNKVTVSYGNHKIEEEPKKGTKVITGEISPGQVEALIGNPPPNNKKVQREPKKRTNPWARGVERVKDPEETIYGWVIRKALSQNIEIIPIDSNRIGFDFDLSRIYQEYVLNKKDTFTEHLKEGVDTEIVLGATTLVGTVRNILKIALGIFKPKKNVTTRENGLSRREFLKQVFIISAAIGLTGPRIIDIASGYDPIKTYREIDQSLFGVRRLPPERGELIVTFRNIIMAYGLTFLKRLGKIKDGTYIFMGNGHIGVNRHLEKGENYLEEEIIKYAESMIREAIKNSKVDELPYVLAILQGMFPSYEEINLEYPNSNLSANQSTNIKSPKTIYLETLQKTLEENNLPEEVIQKALALCLIQINYGREQTKEYIEGLKNSRRKGNEIEEPSKIEPSNIQIQNITLLSDPYKINSNEGGIGSNNEENIIAIIKLKMAIREKILKIKIGNRYDLYVVGWTNINGRPYPVVKKIYRNDGYPEELGILVGYHFVGIEQNSS